MVFFSSYIDGFDRWKWTCGFFMVCTVLRHRFLKSSESKQTSKTLLLSILIRMHKISKHNSQVTFTCIITFDAEHVDDKARGLFRSLFTFDHHNSFSCSPLVLNLKKKKMYEWKLYRFTLNALTDYYYFFFAVNYELYDFLMNIKIVCFPFSRFDGWLNIKRNEKWNINLIADWFQFFFSTLKCFFFIFNKFSFTFRI